MTQQPWDKFPRQAEVINESIDRLDELFVGRIHGTTGVILETNSQSTPIQIQGELLLYGELLEDSFTLKQVRRVALHGISLNQAISGPFDTYSIAGPLQRDDFEQVGQGEIGGLRVQFNYQELLLAGLDLWESSEEDDAYFPPWVRMVGNLRWRQAGPPTAIGVVLAIHLEFIDDPDGDTFPNRAQALRFEQDFFVQLYHSRATSSADDDTSSFFLRALSLTNTACSTLLPPCLASSPQENIRELSIHLVNLSSSPIDSTLLDLCNQQIAGVCEVWRTKAILAPQISPAYLISSNGGFSDFSTSLWSALRKRQDLSLPDSIGVYIVDRLFKSTTELSTPAYTLGGGSKDADVFMKRGALQHNRYLLAHELGHVLALAHPAEGVEGEVIIDRGARRLVGSPNTIIQPSADATSPNLSANSRKNCDIYQKPFLNPLAQVMIPNVLDCLRPDF